MLANIVDISPVCAIDNRCGHVVPLGQVKYLLEDIIVKLPVFVRIFHLYGPVGGRTRRFAGECVGHVDNDHVRPASTHIDAIHHISDVTRVVRVVQCSFNAVLFVQDWHRHANACHDILEGLAPEHGAPILQGYLGLCADARLVALVDGVRHKRGGGHLSSGEELRMPNDGGGHRVFFEPTEGSVPDAVLLAHHGLDQVVLPTIRKTCYDCEGRLHGAKHNGDVEHVAAILRLREHRAGYVRSRGRAQVIQHHVQHALVVRFDREVEWCATRDRNLVARGVRRREEVGVQFHTIRNGVRCTPRINHGSYILHVRICDIPAVPKRQNGKDMREQRIAQVLFRDIDAPHAARIGNHHSLLPLGGYGLYNFWDLRDLRRNVGYDRHVR